MYLFLLLPKHSPVVSSSCMESLPMTTDDVPASVPSLVPVPLPQAINPLSFKLVAFDGEKYEKATRYVATCIDTWTETENPRLDVACPSVEGLAAYLDTTKANVERWRRDNPFFNELVEKVLNAQAVRLINGGLSGQYNPSIAKVMLSRHGYIEKGEVDFSSGGKPLPIPLLAFISVAPKVETITEIKTV